MAARRQLAVAKDGRYGQSFDLSSFHLRPSFHPPCARTATLNLREPAPRPRRPARHHDDTPPASGGGIWALRERLDLSPCPAGCYGVRVRAYGRGDVLEQAQGRWGTTEAPDYVELEEWVRLATGGRHNGPGGPCALCGLASHQTGGWFPTRSVVVKWGNEPRDTYYYRAGDEDVWDVGYADEEFPRFVSACLPCGPANDLPPPCCQRRPRGCSNNHEVRGTAGLPHPPGTHHPGLHSPRSWSEPGSQGACLGGRAALPAPPKGGRGASRSDKLAGRSLARWASNVGASDSYKCRTVSALVPRCPLSLLSRVCLLRYRIL